MGITHFAGLGTSPGAVTCALAYLGNEPQFANTLWGDIIENLVIFSGEGVLSGKDKPQDYVYNYYMRETIKSTYKQSNVVDTICDFVKRELKSFMPDGAKIYSCCVDPYDFEDCFRKVGQALLQLSPPGKTGKHIWANITGGTNPLNAAIFQAAFLSGLVSKVYYTFVSRREDMKFLQPFTKDQARFQWREIPLIKTTFDRPYYEVLKLLDRLGTSVDKVLLERLKQESPQAFAEITINTFRREYLNKLDGRGISRLGNKNSITPEGQKILAQLNDPLFQMLIYRGLPQTTPAGDALPQISVLKEIWRKQ